MGHNIWDTQYQGKICMYRVRYTCIPYQTKGMDGIFFCTPCKVYNNSQNLENNYSLCTYYPHFSRFFFQLWGGGALPRNFKEANQPPSSLIHP